MVANLKQLLVKKEALDKRDAESADKDAEAPKMPNFLVVPRLAKRLRQRTKERLQAVETTTSMVMLLEQEFGLPTQEVDPKFVTLMGLACNRRKLEKLELPSDIGSNDIGRSTTACMSGRAVPEDRKGEAKEEEKNVDALSMEDEATHETNGGTADPEVEKRNVRSGRFLRTLLVGINNDGEVELDFVDDQAGVRGTPVGADGKSSSTLRNKPGWKSAIKNSFKTGYPRTSTPAKPGTAEKSAKPGSAEKKLRVVDVKTAGKAKMNIKDILGTVRSAAANVSVETKTNNCAENAKPNADANSKVDSQSIVSESKVNNAKSKTEESDTVDDEKGLIIDEHGEEFKGVSSVYFRGECPKGGLAQSILLKLDLVDSIRRTLLPDCLELNLLPMKDKVILEKKKEAFYQEWLSRARRRWHQSGKVAMMIAAKLDEKVRIQDFLTNQSNLTLREFSDMYDLYDTSDAKYLQLYKSMCEEGSGRYIVGSSGVFQELAVLLKQRGWSVKDLFYQPGLKKNQWGNLNANGFHMLITGGNYLGMGMRKTKELFTIVEQGIFEMKDAVEQKIFSPHITNTSGSTSKGYFSPNRTNTCASKTTAAMGQPSNLVQSSKTAAGMDQMNADSGNTRRKSEEYANTKPNSKGRKSEEYVDMKPGLTISHLKAAIEIGQQYSAARKMARVLEDAKSRPHAMAAKKLKLLDFEVIVPCSSLQFRVEDDEATYDKDVLNDNSHYVRSLTLGYRLRVRNAAIQTHSFDFQSRTRNTTNSSLNGGVSASGFTDGRSPHGGNGSTSSVSQNASSTSESSFQPLAAILPPELKWIKRFCDTVPRRVRLVSSRPVTREQLNSRGKMQNSSLNRRGNQDSGKNPDVTADSRPRTRESNASKSLKFSDEIVKNEVCREELATCHSNSGAEVGDERVNIVVDNRTDEEAPDLSSLPILLRPRSVGDSSMATYDSSDDDDDVHSDTAFDKEDSQSDSDSDKEKSVFRPKRRCSMAGLRGWNHAPTGSPGLTKTRLGLPKTGSSEKELNRGKSDAEVLLNSTNHLSTEGGSESVPTRGVSVGRSLWSKTAKAMAKKTAKSNWKMATEASTLRKPKFRGGKMTARRFTRVPQTTAGPDQADGFDTAYRNSCNKSREDRPKSEEGSGGLGGGGNRARIAFAQVEEESSSDDEWDLEYTMEDDPYKLPSLFGGGLSGVVAAAAEKKRKEKTSANEAKIPSLDHLVRLIHEQVWRNLRHLQHLDIISVSKRRNAKSRFKNAEHLLHVLDHFLVLVVRFRNCAALFDLLHCNLESRETVQRTMRPKISADLCSRGHVMSIIRLEKLGWNRKAPFACGKCGQLQTYAVQACAFRCEMPGFCRNCHVCTLTRKKELKIRQEQKQQKIFDDKIHHALSNNKYVPMLLDSTTDVFYLVRFQLVANIKMDEYLKDPYKFDCLLINELTVIMFNLNDSKGNGSSCSGSPTRESFPKHSLQIAVIGGFHQYGLALDVVLLHPNAIQTILPGTRHYRPQNVISSSTPCVREGGQPEKRILVDESSMQIQFTTPFNHIDTLQPSISYLKQWFGSKAVDMAKSHSSSTLLELDASLLIPEKTEPPDFICEVDTSDEELEGDSLLRVNSQKQKSRESSHRLFNEVFGLSKQDLTLKAIRKKGRRRVKFVAGFPLKTMEEKWLEPLFDKQKVFPSIDENIRRVEMLTDKNTALVEAREKKFLPGCAPISNLAFTMTDPPASFEIDREKFPRKLIVCNDTEEITKTTKKRFSETYAPLETSLMELYRKVACFVDAPVGRDHISRNDAKRFPILSRCVRSSITQAVGIPKRFCMNAIDVPANIKNPPVTPLPTVGGNSAVVLSKTLLRRDTSPIKRFVQCPMKCNAEPVVDWTLPAHQELCLKRKVPCVLGCCESTAPSSSSGGLISGMGKASALGSLFGGANRFGPKCGEKHPCGGIVFDEMEIHVRKYCPERNVTCPTCGDNRILAKNLEQHKKSACPLLSWECNLCGLNLDIVDKENHINNDCVKRLVTCGWCSEGRSCEGGNSTKVGHDKQSSSKFLQPMEIRKLSQDGTKHFGTNIDLTHGVKHSTTNLVVLADLGHVSSDAKKADMEQRNVFTVESLLEHKKCECPGRFRKRMELKKAVLACDEKAVIELLRDGVRPDNEGCAGGSTTRLHGNGGPLAVSTQASKGMQSSRQLFASQKTRFIERFYGICEPEVHWTSADTAGNPLGKTIRKWPPTLLEEDGHSLNSSNQLQLSAPIEEKEIDKHTDPHLSEKDLRKARRKLLQDVREHLDEYTTLHISCILGEVGILAHLLDYKADIRECTSHDRTAFHFAALYGHVNCLKVLLLAEQKKVLTGGEGNLSGGNVNFAGSNSKVICPLVDPTSDTAVVTVSADLEYRHPVQNSIQDVTIDDIIGASDQKMRSTVYFHDSIASMLDREGRSAKEVAGFHAQKASELLLYEYEQRLKGQPKPHVAYNRSPTKKTIYDLS